MKNLLLVCGFIFLVVAGFSQNKVNLMPDSMVCYVGRLARPEFEKLAGAQVGAGRNGQVLYVVCNAYDGEVTLLKCFYRETDLKLLSVGFKTARYLNYWLAFSYLDGYEAERDCCVRRGRRGEVTGVDLRHKGLGCRISDVKRLNPHLVTAVVTYQAVGL